jgi:hypothetical protein
MEWINYFQRIALINLADRFDRLYDTIQIMDEYKIPFERFEATRHENGALGLGITMKNLFNDCLERGIDNCLVFEDDVEFCEQPEYFHLVMNKCVEGLMQLNWGQFFLGCQHVRPFNHFVKPHLLPVTAGYSTHAVAYTKHAMQFFVNNWMFEPIDNFLVREYQKFNISYCAYPLLATQRTNYSNICMEDVDWNKHIQKSYREATMHLFNKK